jgi:predicted DNA-binding antitoxin AbrB/MazE fold protein
MTITVDAVCENGTLKLDQPLPLAERQKVKVTIEPDVSLARRTAGMIGWKGDAETFERIGREAEETQYS